MTPLPQSVVWEVTSRCDQRCTHCYNVWTAPDAESFVELDAAGRSHVLDNLSTARRALTALTISGGEPLLVSGLAELVLLARQKLRGVKVNIATNGWGLTRQRARALKRAGVDVFQLSLHAARPQIHDEMVGRSGAHTAAMEAMANAKAAGAKVAVFFVATRCNCDDWPGAAKLAVSLGADAVVFNLFQPGGRGLTHREQLQPTPAQLSAAVARITELRRLTTVRQGTPLPPCMLDQTTPFDEKLLDILNCPIGTKQAYPTISPDGTLRPCNHWPVDGGSLLDRPFNELLQAPLFRAPPAAMLHPQCKECEHEDRCRGGCPAVRALTASREIV